MTQHVCTMKFTLFVFTAILSGSILLNAQTRTGPLVSEAIRLSESRDFAGTIRLLNDALAIDSLQQQAYTLLATSFLNISRPDSALHVITRGNVFYPDDLFLMVAKAEALYLLERHGEALPLYLEVDGHLQRGAVSIPDVTASSLRSRISSLYALKANEMFQRDDAAGAERYVQLALRFQPDDPGLHRSLVLVYLQMENWEDASKAAIAGLEKSGPDTTLLRLKAKAQYELKDYPRLLQTAEQLNSLAPGSPEVHLLYAEALLLNERTLEGVAKITTMIDLFPDVREPYRALAQLHRRRLDFPGVAAILEKESRRFPDDGGVLRELAETYEILGEWEKARIAYDAFGKVTGDPLTASLLQARTFERQDSLSGAIKEYGNILLEDPDQPDALAGLGQIYNRLQRWVEAAQIFKTLNQKRPDAKVTGFLGWSLEQSGQLSEARESYERAVQWQTTDPLPYYRLSIMVKDSSGSLAFDLAETALRKALALVEQTQQLVMEDVNMRESSPGQDRREEKERHEEASDMVETVFYYMLSQFDTAELSAMIGRVLTMHPGSGRLHYLGGILYRKTGNRDAALEQFSLGARYSPGHAPIHAALAEEHESRNEIQQALLSSERALSLDPLKRDYYSAVVRLSEKSGMLDALCDRWLARYRARKHNAALREALIGALHKAGRMDTAAGLLRDISPE